MKVSGKNGKGGKEEERRKSSKVLTSLFIRIYRVQTRRGGEKGQKKRRQRLVNEKLKELWEED